MRCRLLAVLVGVFVAGCGPSAEQIKYGAEQDAREACESFVTHRLKTPSTATITTRDTAVMIAPGKWRSKGAYDAQNTFGATVRGYFVCEVQYRQGADYDLVALAMK